MFRRCSDESGGIIFNLARRQETRLLTAIIPALIRLSVFKLNKPKQSSVFPILLIYSSAIRPSYATLKAPFVTLNFPKTNRIFAKNVFCLSILDVPSSGTNRTIALAPHNSWKLKYRHQLAQILFTWISDLKSWLARQQPALCVSTTNNPMLTLISSYKQYPLRTLVCPRS